LKKKSYLWIVYAIRTVIIVIWVILSTIVYGIFCLLIAPFFRKFGRWISILWAKHIAFFSGVNISIRGLEHLDPDKNYVFISNHLSYSDIIVLFVGLPYNLSFIAKKSLFLIPIWGWAVYLTGHIPIDRSHPKKARHSIERAYKTIREKNKSIFGFPEGSRSRTGEMGPFKLGLFSLAIQTGIDVVPAALHGTREVLKPGSFVLRPRPVVLEVTPPISVKDYTQRNKNALADKTWKIIHDLVEKKKQEEKEK
jgi:1-acyl-sn-glycerol-3-phosphate acyltransferase